MTSSLQVHAQTCNLRVLKTDDFGTGASLFGPSLGSATDYFFMDGTSIQSCGSNTYHQRVEDSMYCLIKTADSALVTCTRSGKNPNYTYAMSSDWVHAPDHTGNNGYMLLVNSKGTKNTFYQKTYDNLCPGMTCNFTIYATNICHVSGSIQPKLTIVLKNADTDEGIDSISSGALPYPISTTQLKWVPISMTFKVPAGFDRVKVVVRNDQTGNGGNDLALDDVAFSVCVPPATLTSVAKTRTAAECASQTFDITAAVTTGTFTNINYQWQIQNADGTWANVTNPNGIASSKFTTPSLPASGGPVTYRVIYASEGNLGSDNCSGFSNPITVTPTDITPKAPVVTSNAPLCEGQKLNFTFSSTTTGATFELTNPAGVTSTPSSPYSIASVQASDAGTYSIRSYYSGCYSTPTKITAIVNSKPVIAVSAQATSLCVGDQIQLKSGSAGSGETYLWGGPSPFTSGVSDPIINNAGTGASGDYTLTVTSADNCVSTGKVTVTVNPKPAVPTINPYTPVCEGMPLALSAPTISGYSYKWTWPTNNSASGANLSIASQASLSDALTYTLTATINATGCFASNSIAVTVNPKPAIPSVSSSGAVCEGEPLNLYANVASGTYASFKWTSPKGAVFSTDEDPVINKATSADIGTYTLQATAANGCFATNTVAATVKPNPVVTASVNNPCEKDALQFDATSSLTGSTFSWSGPSFNSLSQSPVINNVTTADGGIYKVTVTYDGCPAEAQVTASVKPMPAMPTIALTPVCEGFDQLLKATSSTAGVIYNWSGASPLVVNNNEAIIKGATAASSGVYKVSATLGTCTSADATVDVQIMTTPVVPTIALTPVCEGFDQLMKATSSTTGVTYNWSGASALAVNNDEATIKGATAASNGIYKVSATLGKCTSADATVDVQIMTTPVVPTIALTPVCEGFDQLMKATSSTTGVTYNWSGASALTVNNDEATIKGATAASNGLYKVSATLGKCTSADATVDVQIMTTPIVPTIALTPVCEGLDQLMKATSSTTGVTYNWSGASPLVVNKDEATIKGATAASNGVYKVSATLGKCTSADATVDVQIMTTPIVPTIALTPVCEGFDQLMKATSSTTGVTYNWSGASALTVNNDEATIKAATAASNGVYKVSATLGKCTSADATVDVQIMTTPVVPTIALTPVCEGFDQLMKATSSTTGVTYNWSGASALTVNNDEATIKGATAASNGLYKVSATLGKCTSADATVDVQIMTTPIVPTVALTPVCEGFDQLMKATSSTAGVKYNWSGPGTLTTNNDEATIKAATVAASGIYKVSATLGKCTSADATVDVQIMTTPIVPTIALTPVCEGFDQLMKATSSTTGVTYNWSGVSALTVNNDEATIKGATAASNGLYKVSATLGKCTSADATVDVQIMTTPIVPTIALTPVCEGFDQLMKATSSTTGVTYNWSGASALTVNNDEATIKGATTASNGLYKVSATLGKCTSAYATVDVQIMTTPVVPTIALTPVCEGFDQLMKASSSTVGVKYNWSGVSALTVNNDEATIKGATAASNGLYKVSATLGKCTSANATVDVQIMTTPIVPTIALTPVCEGFDQLMKASSSTAGVTYNWAGVSPLVVNNGEATITAATAASNGLYKVSATLGKCTSADATVDVQIMTMPVVPAIALMPVCEGQDQVLTATSSTAGVKYNWSGVSSLVVNNDKATITAATVAANGLYKVSATLGKCTSADATADVQIMTTPVVPTIALTPVCEGFDQLMKATSSTAGVTYNWAGVSPLVVNNNEATIKAATAAASGLYKVSATLGKCTSADATANVQIMTTPIVPTIALTPVCEGFDQLMKAKSSTVGVSYNWSGASPLLVNKDEATIKGATAASNGLYKVSATLGKCTSADATVDVQIMTTPVVPTIALTPVCEGFDQLMKATSSTAGVKYNWSGVSALTVNNDEATIKGATAASNGLYKVSATLGKCTSADATVDVQIMATPIVPTIALTPVCEGFDQLMKAKSSTAGVTYNWSGATPLVVNKDEATIKGATAASNGLYKVSATLGKCTSADATVNVQILTTPLVPTIALTPVCEGFDQLMKATSSTAGVKYNWSGASVLTVNNDEATIKAATAASNGLYKVSATLGKCTSADATVNVQIMTTPVVPTIALTPVCEGFDQLMKATSSTAGVTYNWSGASPLVVNKDQATIKAATAASNGLYKVSATLGKCTSSDAKVDVQIMTTPIAPTIALAPVCEGFDQVMKATSSTAGVTYNWSGASTLVVNKDVATIKTATVAANGLYKVSATLGKCTSANATVNVQIMPTPVVPTIALTPVCEGFDQVMKATTSTVGVTYNWSGASALIVNKDQATIKAATVAANGVYKVSATLGKCTSADATVNVQIMTTPVVPTIALAPVCEGFDQVLKATSSTIGVVYNWSGASALTVNKDQATIKAATVAANGLYKVSATLGKCTSSDATVNVQIMTTPVVPTIAFTPVCEGSDQLIKATSSTTGVIYNWSGASALTVNKDQATIKAATVAANGVYKVSATLGKCTSADATVNVQIKPTPAKPTIVSKPVCEGVNLDMVATTNQPGASFAWSGVNSFTASGSIATVKNATRKDNGTYSVTAKLNECPSLPGNIIITLKNVPAKPTVSWPEVCEGSNLDMTANTDLASVTYAWAGVNNFKDTGAIATLPKATRNDNGDYTVTATLNGCSSMPATTTVAIKVMPVMPTATWNNGLCEGTDLQLSAATTTPGIIKYAWAGPAGYSSASQKPLIASATIKNNGDYTVTATLNGCTSQPATTTVAVKVMPVVPSVAWNSGVCENSDLNLSASSTTPGTIKYDWSGPLSFVSATQNPVIKNSTIKNNGDYTVTATLNGCTSKPAITTVAVKVMPIVPTVAWNNGLCEGTDLQLSAATTTPGIISYAWSGPAGYTSTSQKPVITGATIKNSGDYTVTASLNGCTTDPVTTKVMVKVMPLVPVVSWNNGLCEGSDLTLNAASSTAGDIAYSWTGPSGFSSDIQQPVIKNASFATSSGAYSVTATLNNCTSAPAAIVVAVKEVPKIPLIQAVDPLCEGENLQLTAASSAVSTGTIQYSWAGPSGYKSDISNPLIATVSPTTNAGQYSVSATLDGCTSASSSIQVKIKIRPAIPDIQSNDPLCEGSDLQLKAATTTAGAIAYSWTGPAAFKSGKQSFAIQSVTSIDNSGIYAVTATLNGCVSDPATRKIIVKGIPNVPSVVSNAPLCAGTDLSLNATTSTPGTATYSWTGPNGFKSDNGNASVTGIDLNAAGVYHVAVTVDGCTSAAADLRVVVNSLPAPPVVTSPSPVCAGNGRIQLVDHVRGQNVTWFAADKSLIGATAPAVSLDKSGTFVYYVANNSVQNCRSELVKVMSIVNENPKATARKRDVSCVGGSDGRVELVVSGGQFPYRFQWNNGSNERSLVNVASGVYSATVTDLRGCNARSSDAIVNDGINPPAPIAKSMELCETGGTVMLSAKGTNLQWYSYDGVPLASAPYINKSGPASYAYYVSSRSDLGCESEKTFVSALVRSSPKVTSVKKQEPDCNGYEKGSFEVIADGGCNNSAYTFKLLNTLQEQSVGTFANVPAGTYKVQVSDECGCSTTQDIELGIKMTDCDIQMPTGFTPNGDKNNDVFRPAAYGKVSDYKLQLYNRWGQLLFQTETPGEGWDGKYRGKDQPVATYVWQMFYKNQKGESKYLKGTVVLIR